MGKNKAGVDENAIDFSEMKDGVRNVYLDPEERALIRTADVYETDNQVGTVGYSDKLVSIVANYANSGKPAGYNCECMVGKSKKGEVALRFFAVVDPATRTFAKVGFQSRGCLAVTACASATAGMLEGKTFDEALAITTDDVSAAVDGVPWDKTYTLYYATEGIRALVGDFLLREGMTLDAFNETGLCNDSSVGCIMCEHCSLRSIRTARLVDSMVGADAAPQPLVAVSLGAVGEDAATPVPDVSAPAVEEPAHEPTEEEKRLAEHNALAKLFDHVRDASSKSALTTPSQWADAGLVPAHMTSEDFEMFVYDWIEEHVPDAAVDPKAYAEGAASRPSRHVVSRYRTATRAVGVPTWFAKKTVAEDAPDAADAGVAADAVVAADAEGAAQPDLIPNFDPHNPATAPAAEPEEEKPVATSPHDKVFGRLRIPEGYDLVELEGEYVLVPAEDTTPVELKIDASNIRMFVGFHSYYLYDAGKMTDQYAHWSYLAAEDNDEVTFADCVRTESRTYPRPMPAASLSNPPFNKSVEEAQAIWERMRDSGNYPDIKRTEASNGDVYYYSTDYLTDEHAATLAEFASVERPLSV